MSGVASEGANCSHQFIDELPHSADELNHMTALARRYDAHHAVLAKDEKTKKAEYALRIRVERHQISTTCPASFASLAAKVIVLA